MPSAVIRSFDYDAARNELTVRFTTGKVYVYALVPLAVAEALGAAPSKGAFFNDAVRDKYPHRRCKAEVTPWALKALLSKSSES